MHVYGWISPDNVWDIELTTLHRLINDADEFMQMLGLKHITG